MRVPCLFSDRRDVGREYRRGAMVPAPRWPLRHSNQCSPCNRAPWHPCVTHSGKGNTPRRRRLVIRAGFAPLQITWSMFPRRAVPRRVRFSPLRLSQAAMTRFAPCGVRREPTQTSWLHEWRLVTIGIAANQCRGRLPGRTSVARVRGMPPTLQVSDHPGR